MKPYRIVLGCLFVSFCSLSGGTWAQVATEFGLVSVSAGSQPLFMAVGPDGNLWFTEFSGNRIGRITPQGVVTEFSVGISPGAGPNVITAGPDGNLWFTENLVDRIGRITPAGVVTEFSAGISSGAEPREIAKGADGNLWFTEGNGNRIGRITTTGVVTEFSAGITAGALPDSITAGPDGNLWFTEADGDRIGRITTTGVVTEFTGMSPGANPVGITTGPDGKLWFTEFNGNRIGRINPGNGAIGQFSTGITAGAAPTGITAGPDGNVWFTEFTGSRIARITPLGVVTEFSTGGGVGPAGITAGPDGNLWFAEFDGAKIGRITPLGVLTELGAVANPVNITDGPDGNLWFTETNGNRIGRITPLGVVTEFAAGISVNAGPYDITAGPDGNLWFTESNTSRIGRITPLGVVAEFSAGITPNAGLAGITAGPDGNLWFTENFATKIGRITPAGFVTEFNTGLTAFSGPLGITAGPDGNLWFTEYPVAKIGRITPLGVITEFGVGISHTPARITTGPDGNLWFTESAQQVGRITPAGVVTEFAAGISFGSNRAGITAGPDGNLWFTEEFGDRIARITPAGVVTEFTAGITGGAGLAGITAGPDGNLWFTEANGNRIGRIGTTPSFVVTNNNDSGPGSLRDAIAQANASGVSQTITFAPAVTGTILLTSGTIAINAPVTIAGPGAAALTIDGNAANRIFLIIDPGSTTCPALTGPSDYLVSISGLTLANAHRNTDNTGGAIATFHSVALDSVVIRDNAAKAGAGVSMLTQYPGQTLTITNSTFSNNTAMPLSVVTSDSQGGALRVAENCTGNRTEPVTVNIAGSTFSGNGVQPVDFNGRGGAIGVLSYADVTITDTRITGNHVDAPNPPAAGMTYYGGGIFASIPKSMSIVRSEISGNSVNDVTASDQTRSGGIHISNAASDLQAPADATTLTVVNSTISGNIVAATAGAMLVNGNVAVEIDNATVANNGAGSTRTGGIVITTGATSPPTASNASSPTLTLNSTILATNNGTGGDLATNTATIPTFTVNASDSAIQTTCPTCGITVSGAGNLLNTDPMLGPLATNGGPTQTQALLAGSPAINAGSNPLALSTDQRGVTYPRVVGAAADMGAYEFNPVAAPVFQSAVSRRTHGAAGTFDLPLNAVRTNPTTEPRQGPAQTIVFTFDKPIAAATVTITEGSATAAAPTFGGNSVVVGLSGVPDQKYVKIALSNVASSDGGTGGSGSVRVGFLAGDVNQSRVVSIADLGLVNAQLAQLVTAANFLKDVNASGTITLADKGITNANLTKALPAP